MNKQVEFDDAKRAETLESRKLDMARALEIFSEPTLTVQDDRRDYGENRYFSVGFLDAEMVVIVWTPRNSALRIISMRKANERERRLFEPRLRPG